MGLRCGAACWWRGSAMDAPANESLVRRLHAALNEGKDARAHLHIAYRLHNDAAIEAAFTAEEIANELLRGVVMNISQLVTLELGMLKEDVAAIVIRLGELEIEIRAKQREAGK